MFIEFNWEETHNLDQREAHFVNTGNILPVSEKKSLKFQASDLPQWARGLLVSRYFVSGEYIFPEASVLMTVESSSPFSFQKVDSPFRVVRFRLDFPPMSDDGVSIAFAIEKTRWGRVSQK